MKHFLMVVFVLLGGSAQAALCPPGAKINPANIYRGTGDCGLATGDDLAAASAGATNASNLTTGTVPSARLPPATPTTLGGVTISTGLSGTAGALSVIYGTGAGQAVQGNAIGSTVAPLVSGVVPAAYLVNRPMISPTTATVGTSATTIFPVGTYLSIRIALTSAGSLACTGDGTTPALGGSGTAAYGQDIHWPVIAGGALPSGPIRCIADRSSTISTEAH